MTAPTRSVFPEQPTRSIYPEEQIRCPSCENKMNLTFAGDAEVDVCGVCGAVWIDWFDGPPEDVARDAAKVIDRIEHAPESGRATVACPRCATKLVREDGRPLSCPSCSGLLVHQHEMDAIAKSDASRAKDPTLADFMQTLRTSLVPPRTQR